jgi:tetratricopeptide (TPR) repeat protein
LTLFVISRNRSEPPPAAQQPAQQIPKEPQRQPGQPLPNVEPLEAQFMRANELVSQSKPDQAAAEFRQVAENAEKMLESNPDLSPELRARLHSLAGQSWLAIDQPDRAQLHFQAMIDLAPKNAEPLVGMAAVHLLQDRLDAANEALDRAIRLNPDLGSAHLLKACAFIKQNERAPALREIRLAGGPEALLKTQPWINPVLKRIDCAPDRFK